MKITDIKSYVYAPLPATPWFFIEVETDEGITGLGETSDYRATQMLAGGIDAIKHLLIGEDPSHIEELWQRVFRNYSTINGRGFVSHLVSAVDVALWDIRGKALGQPVYQLLGGPVRPNVPLYTHIQDQSYEGVTIADAVAAARRTKDAGYEAIKTDPFKSQRPQGGPFLGASMVEFLNPNSIAEAVDWIAALRGELGPGYELMVDAHGRFDVASAIRAGRALEPYDLIWYEEPVPPESFQALREVRGEHQHSHLRRRTTLHALRLRAGVRAAARRLRDAGHPVDRRHQRDQEDRGDGRGVLRAHLTARRVWVRCR